MIQGGPRMADMVGIEYEYDELGNPMSVGSHRGNFASLNVRNPKPGYRYYYEATRSGRVLRRLNMGWEVVAADDQEQWGADLPMSVQAALDTTRPFGDVLLMRAPEEVVRREQQELAERAREAREGPERTFLDKNAEVQAALGTYAPGSDVYFKTRDHAVVVVDE